jgi:hypothetical protein
VALLQLPLLIWSDEPVIEPVALFDGKTFEPEQDGPRLSSQLVATRELMLDGEWRNLAQIVLALRKQGIHVTEASISARLRDLRKLKFGGYSVERRRLIGGLWEYRVSERAEEFSALDPEMKRLADASDVLAGVQA